MANIATAVIILDNEGGDMKESRARPNEDLCNYAIKRIDGKDWGASRMARPNLLNIWCLNGTYLVQTSGYVFPTTNFLLDIRGRDVICKPSTYDRYMLHRDVCARLGVIATCKLQRFST